MREGSKWIGWTILGVLALVAVIFASIFISGTISRTTADYRGKTGQIEKVKADANYRIANYDKFYDMDAQIKSLGQQICVMKQNKSIPKDQVETNVLALTNQRISLVNEYNADARKNDTQANYRASDLPYQQEESFTCDE